MKESKQLEKPSNSDRGEFIKFLGTGGARFVIARQLRSSGGVYLALGNKRIIFDPGPGALVKLAASKPKLDATELDAVILSHSHIDHANDVNIIIDAMTNGGLQKRGLLFAPGDCIQGDSPVVFNYLRSFLQDIIILQANRNYNLSGLSFFTSIRHRHPVETYGVTFDWRGRKISFMTDTKYFPELMDSYKHTDLLVINVVGYSPYLTDRVQHLCVEDVKEILLKLRPKKTILTHFGLTMLKARPWIVANELKEELGLDVVAASDGLTVKLDEDLFGVP